MGGYILFINLKTIPHTLTPKPKKNEYHRNYWLCSDDTLGHLVYSQKNALGALHQPICLLNLCSLRLATGLEVAPHHLQRHCVRHSSVPLVYCETRPSDSHANTCLNSLFFESVGVSEVQKLNNFKRVEVVKKTFLKRW